MKRVGVTLILTMLLAVAPAYAQSPPGDAYGGQGGVAGTVATGGNAAPSAPANNGSGVAGARAQQAKPSVAGARAQQAKPSVAGARSAAAPATASAARNLQGGRLPFTGFDVVLMLLGGAALLAVGVTMRRFARPPA